MKEEVWGDILEFEGLYQASTLGRIRSVDRELLVDNPTGTKAYCRKHKGVILNTLKDKNGFNYVVLYKDGISSKLLIHRLVADTFLDNPDGYKYVSFKDCDRDNIAVVNLERTNKKHRWR